MLLVVLCSQHNCEESCADDDRRPYLATTLKDGQLHYRNVRNKFDLKLGQETLVSRVGQTVSRKFALFAGQWTDDASMALCSKQSVYRLWCNMVQQRQMRQSKPSKLSNMA